MKLAFSTNAFTRFSLVEAIELIGRAGYAGIEILADEPHAYPLRIDAELTRNVVAALSRANLSVSNINANCTFGYWRDAPPEPFFEPSLISPNRAHRLDRISMIRRTLEFARDIGAKNVSITSGKLLPGMPPTKAVDQLSESLRRVLDDAESFGIDIGIELEPGLYLEWVDELVDWIDRMNSPRLGANLDVGHCQVIGEDGPAMVRKLRGRIWNCHIEGMAGRKHYHLVPGDEIDTFDWRGFFDALRETSYDRFATVELYTMPDRPNEAAAESLAFLKGFITRE